MEIQRYANIVPIGISHMSPNHNITVNGLPDPALANTELFLFVTGIVQQFSLLPEV